MERDIGGGSGMIRKVIAALSIAVFVLTASAGKTTQGSKYIAHACCYCNCRIADYHKNCHKLCVLPEKKNGKVRALNKTEDRFCIELCAIKKEGKEHLQH